MSAIDRVNRDSKGRMMIPVNVEGIVDSEGLTTKQAIVLGGLGLLLLIDIFWFKDTRLANSFWIWVANIAIYILIAQFFIRKLVINEKYKMQQIKLLEQLQHCAPVLSWDIMAVNDDTGIMQYSDGRVAVLLDVEQATIVGRPADFNHTHYNAISNYLYELNRNGLKWIHMNLMINARNDTRLSVLAETVKDCDIPAIQEMTRSHLGFLKSMEARTLYEREFYLVVGSPAQGAERLINVIEDALVKLGAAAYNRIAIVKDREILAQIMAETCLIDSFDADETMRQMAKAKAVIKPAFEITNIVLDRTLSDEQLAQAKGLSLKDKSVHSQGNSLVIDVNEVVKIKIKSYTTSASKAGVEVERGAFEKHLFMIKDEQKVNTDVVQETVDSKEVANIDRKVDYIFGTEDIANINDLAKAEELEARYTMIALGEEEELKRKEAEDRRRQSAKERMEAEEARKREEQAEEERRAAKRAEIEAAKKEREAREISVKDFID